MKIINIKKVNKQKLFEPLFTGPVTRQSQVTDDEGSQLSIDYVHFPKGIRNKFHKHENDQVLIILKGKGFVVTKKQKVKVKVGDVVWAPAGEEHWHGAASGSNFSHISVTPAHTKLTQTEK